MTTTKGIALFVQQVIEQRPRVSIHRVTAAVEIKPTSTHRLIGQSFHLYIYKIQTPQLLSAASIKARGTIANDMMQRIDDADI